jgi:molybdopterin molybdotransferase
LGRILAADIIAPHDVPAHDNSAMDGYAVHFDSLSRHWRNAPECGRHRLCRQCLLRVGRQGQAVRIMTGAVLPAGADTVVVQEVTRLEDGVVFVPAGQRPRPEHPARRRGSGAGRCAAGRQAGRPGRTGA